MGHFAILWMTKQNPKNNILRNPGYGLKWSSDILILLQNRYQTVMKWNITTRVYTLVLINVLDSSTYYFSDFDMACIFWDCHLLLAILWLRVFSWTFRWLNSQWPRDLVRLQDFFFKYLLLQFFYRSSVCSPHLCHQQN